MKLRRPALSIITRMYQQLRPRGFLLWLGQDQSLAVLTSFLREAALKMSAGATCALSPKITILASDGSSYVAHSPSVMRRSARASASCGRTHAGALEGVADLAGCDDEVVYAHRLPCAHGNIREKDGCLLPGHVLQNRTDRLPLTSSSKQHNAMHGVHMPCMACE